MDSLTDPRLDIGGNGPTPIDLATDLATTAAEWLADRPEITDGRGQGDEERKRRAGRVPLRQGRARTVGATR